MERLGDVLGRPGASWGVLGGFLASLEGVSWASSGVWAAFWVHAGPSWGLLGASWERLGMSRERLELSLGRFGDVLRCLGGILEILHLG